jgi:hypothetical protein
MMTTNGPEPQGPPPSTEGERTFLTINGVMVDAGHTIDALLGQIAELTLKLAAERAHNRHLSEVLTMRVADPASSPSDGSGGPPGPAESPAWEPAAGL